MLKNSCNELQIEEYQRYYYEKASNPDPDPSWCSVPTPHFDVWALDYSPELGHYGRQVGSNPTWPLSF